jgi:hypothetical protein
VFGFGMCKSWGTVHENNAKPPPRPPSISAPPQGLWAGGEIGVDLLTRSRPSPADDGARLPAPSYGSGYAGDRVGRGAARPEDRSESRAKTDRSRGQRSAIMHSVYPTANRT